MNNTIAKAEDETEIALDIRVDDDEVQRFYVSTEGLRPMVSDDRLKRAIARSIDQVVPDTRWNTPWRPAATSRESYIDSIMTPYYIRGLAAFHIPDNPNLLCFDNEGGLFNGGVCWWHSRFQRAALYLAYFVPEAPRPDTRRARTIIHSIMSADAVVAIPGYTCLGDFARDHQREIQKCLERTQLVEATLGFCWVDGLLGKTELAPDKMQHRMDEIYRAVQEDGLAYLKLQIPGIDAHAWVITDMLRRDDGGYVYQVLDSNFSGNVCQFGFNPGETKLAFFGEDFGVPYLERRSELRRIKRIISKFCDS